MSTLHLTHVDYSRRALVMRAVRRLLIAAGYPEESALAEAERAVYSVLNGHGPYGLVQSDRNTVLLAAEEFSATLGAAFAEAGRVGIDLPVPEGSDEPPEPPSPNVSEIDRDFDPSNMPADFEPSRAARRTALVLMQMADGSAQTAWFFSKMLARNTEQPDFWVEVGRTIGDAFTFQS